MARASQHGRPQLRGNYTLTSVNWVEAGVWGGAPYPHQSTRDTHPTRNVSHRPQLELPSHSRDHLLPAWAAEQTARQPCRPRLQHGGGYNRGLGRPKATTRGGVAISPGMARQAPLGAVHSRLEVPTRVALNRTKDGPEGRILRESFNRILLGSAPRPDLRRPLSRRRRRRVHSVRGAQVHGQLVRATHTGARSLAQQPTLEPKWHHGDT